VAKIVDDHKGWIRLENEPQQGARFRLFFPLAPDSEREPRMEPAATTAKRLKT
jgi:signal transduction histidine kinase